MNPLLKTISLFLILFLTIPNTFGNTTIYEGEYLKVYNIFYNAFSDNSEKELNAKLDEADKIIKTKDLGGIHELVNVIKVALGNLIFEKYPKETNCDDLLGPGGKLYEYDFSGEKPFSRLENGGEVKYNTNDIFYLIGAIENTAMKRGDVVSMHFKTKEHEGFLRTTVVEYAGKITSKILIISKNKCDIYSKDNIYSPNGIHTNILLNIGYYDPGYPSLEKNTDYYVTFINKIRNEDDTFQDDNCPNGIGCGFFSQSSIHYFKDGTLENFYKNGVTPDSEDYID